MTIFPEPLYAAAESAVILQKKLCFSGVVNWQSEMNVMRNTYIVQNNTKTTVTLYFTVSFVTHVHTIAITVNYAYNSP